MVRTNYSGKYEERLRSPHLVGDEGIIIAGSAAPSQGHIRARKDLAAAMNRPPTCDNPLIGASPEGD